MMGSACVTTALPMEGCEAWRLSRYDSGVSGASAIAAAAEAVVGSVVMSGSGSCSVVATVDKMPIMMKMIMMLMRMIPHGERQRAPLKVIPTIDSL